MEIRKITISIGFIVMEEALSIMLFHLQKSYKKERISELE